MLSNVLMIKDESLRKRGKIMYIRPSRPDEIYQKLGGGRNGKS